MVFATQLRKLYRDKTPPAYLDGKAKTICALTQAATKLYRRPLAKMRSGVGVIRLPALQVIKVIMTRQIFDIYQYVSRHAKAQPNYFADAL